jgi:hypothetical protein
MLGASNAPAGAGGTITPLADHVQRGEQHVVGPVFAGTGLAYALPTGRGQFGVKLLDGGTVSTKYVVAVAGRSLRSSEIAKEGLAASGDRVAFADSVITCGDDPSCATMNYAELESRVWSGALGQELGLQGCSAFFNPAVDVSGPMIAYVDECAGGAVVRDPAAPPGTPWRTFPASKDGDVRIAGPYVAVVRDDSTTPRSRVVTVYDWQTGAEAFKVHSTSALPPRFDIQDDGTLVFESSDGLNTEELSRATPQDPSPHAFAQVGTTVEIRIAQGRVAARALSNGAIRVFDLAGTELAMSTTPDSVSTFDFDGQRVAYADQPCEVVGLVTWDLAGPPPALPAGRCPRARLVGHTGTADLKRRSIKLAIRCPAVPALGCGGLWSVDLGPALAGFAHVALGPGEKRTVSFGLQPADACFLSRHRTRTVSIDLGPFSPKRAAEPGGAVKFKLRSVGRARHCK